MYRNFRKRREKIPEGRSGKFGAKRGLKEEREELVGGVLNGKKTSAIGGKFRGSRAGENSRRKKGGSAFGKRSEGNKKKILSVQVGVHIRGRR